MWCQSVFGAFSIVKKGGEGQWQIRARVHSDLLNLIHAAKLEGQQIIDTTNSDYRYRIIVGPEKLHCVFAALERSIDYPNFKGLIGQLPRMEKHCAAYHKIWGILERLQPTRAYGGFRGSSSD